MSKIYVFLLGLLVSSFVSAQPNIKYQKCTLRVIYSIKNFSHQDLKQAVTFDRGCPVITDINTREIREADNVTTSFDTTVVVSYSQCGNKNLASRYLTVNFEYNGIKKPPCHVLYWENGYDKNRICLPQHPIGLAPTTFEARVVHCTEG